MKKLLALFHARNKEFYRDRATLGWTLLFPFIVLVGFTYGYSGRQDPLLKIMVFPERAVGLPGIIALEKIPGLKLVASGDEQAALKKLSRHETDLVLSLKEGTNQLLYSLSQDSDKSKLAERLLLETLKQSPEPKFHLSARPQIGKPVRYADWLLPGLLAMNMMFGSMFGVGYVIVRYRKNGVLKRLRATPLSAFQFLTAQVFSRMLLMIVTSLMVIIGAMVLIGFQNQGSWLDLTVFLGIGSMAMISLGLIIAARMASEEAAEGILNLMTWPMIFLSGVWFSLDGASPWVLFSAKLMPLTHVVDGLRGILIDGVSLQQLSPQIAILLGLSALFVGIASAIFRWR